MEKGEDSVVFKKLFLLDYLIEMIYKLIFC